MTTIPAQIRNASFAALEPRLQGLRMHVFEALQAHGPCTTRELAEREGLSVLTVRPRVHELVELDLAECSGRTRAPAPGSSSEGIYRALTLAEAEARRATAIAPIQGVQTELFGDAQRTPSAYRH